MDQWNTSEELVSLTCSGGRFAKVKSYLLEEVPLEIVINQTRSVLIMCTPSSIRELVIGFLFTEGYIKEPSDIDYYGEERVGEQAGSGYIKVEVKLPGLDKESEKGSVEVARASFSSCGICGKEGYAGLDRGLERVKSHQRFSMGVLMRLPEALKQSQPLYTQTGAAHAAAIFTPNGGLVSTREDLGRHNALDKAIGMTLLEGIRRDDKALLSSGRASLEMILKAARAGFPIFVAISRPTRRAVEAAKYYNITLVDLAKNTNRIYTHARRITGY